MSFFILVGRFSNKKKPSAAKKKVRRAKKKPAKKTLPPPPPPAKRPYELEANAQKSEEPKPKKYITSSSSSSSSESDNAEDSDYTPDAPGDVPNTLNESQESPASCSGTAVRRRKTKTPATYTKKKLFNALMERVCQRCNYVWKDQDDLRVHRESMHPTVPLLELMTLDVQVKIKPNEPAPQSRQSQRSKSKPDIPKPVLPIRSSLLVIETGRRLLQRTREQNTQ